MDITSRGLFVLMVVVVVLHVAVSCFNLLDGRLLNVVNFKCRARPVLFSLS